jgi:ribosomal subunit interface protein
MKIKCENIELTDSLMEVINKDLNKLEKFEINMTDINVLLRKEEGPFHVEIMINSKRFGKISASADNSNIIEAIQEAFTRFESQMIKDKEKQVSHR